MIIHTASSRPRRLRGGKLTTFRPQFHNCPCADEVVLESLLDLSNGFLVRAANMSAEAVKARFRRCPSAFHCVMRRTETGDHDELVGYFILLPLNRTCCEAIRAGTITAGRHIQRSDLADSGDKIAGMYLSVVCGIGPRAQTAAIEGVIATLRELYSSQNVRYLFARAATAAGARMLGRLSGTRFEPDGRIHAIDMAAYDLIAAPC